MQEREMKLKMLSATIMAVVTTLVLLVVVELYARHYFDRVFRISWLREANQMRQAGKDVYPWVNPLRQYLRAPEHWSGTVPDVLTVSGGETGEYTLWTSDSRGFKNPPGHYESRNQFDVVSVGDSFSMARSISLEQSWYRLLETEWKLSSYSVAMGGTGTLTALLNVARYLPGKNVGHVVLGYYSNDFSDTLRESSNKRILAALAAVDNNGAIAAPQAGELQAWKDYLRKHTESYRIRRNFLALSESRKLFSVLYQRYFADTNDHRYLFPDKDRIKVAEDALRRLHKVVTTNGARLVVAYFPSPHDLLNAKAYQPEKKSKLLQGMCANMQACTFVDFHALFSQSGRRPLDYYIKVPGTQTYGHFNTLGNAFVARELSGVLSASDR